MLRVSKECFEAHGKFIAQQLLAALNATLKSTQSQLVTKLTTLLYIHVRSLGWNSL